MEARWAASQIDCIPLMMQGAFRPNAKGWLGVLLGSRVWYAFWACRELEDEAKFEQRVDAVAREIGLRGRRQRTRKKTTPQVEGSTGMPNQQVLKVENQVTEAERGLNAEMVDVKKEVTSAKTEMKQDVAQVKEDVASVKKEMSTEVGEVRKEVAEIKGEIQELKGGMNETGTCSNCCSSNSRSS